METGMSRTDLIQQALEDVGFLFMLEPQSNGSTKLTITFNGQYASPHYIVIGEERINNPTSPVVRTVQVADPVVLKFDTAGAEKLCTGRIIKKEDETLALNW